jgi:hypothetical protein
MPTTQTGDGMSRKSSLVVLVLLAVVGGYLLWGRTVGVAQDAPLAPYSLRPVGVENAEVFRAAGVYPWKWKIGLPLAGDAPQEIRVQYTTKDGPKRVISIPVPTRQPNEAAEADLMAVVQFDARTPLGGDKLTCTLSIGGSRGTVSVQNPFKGSGSNSFSNMPSAQDGRVVLTTVRHGDDMPLELELVVGPKSD